MRIWRDSQEQTIAFETQWLQGQVFKIVIPELISDSLEPIVPWSQRTPEWTLGEDFARWEVEIPDRVHMEAEVLFQAERILARVRVTNLSTRAWELLNPFVCFAYYAAPLFDDPQLTRTFLPVEGAWKSIADLFAESDPGKGPYTFFPVSGGPALGDMWVCRRIGQFHPQVVSRGCACVVSSDGCWVAGMTAENPAYVFANRRERCIHADPLLGRVGPGETGTGTSSIHIFRGGLVDMEAWCVQEI